MGYTVQDNMIYCHHLGNSTSSQEEEDDEDDNEEEEDEEHTNVNGTDDAPTTKPHALPMDFEPSYGAQSASSSAEFKTRMDRRMDWLEDQLNTMQTDIYDLTQDIAQMNLNQERMRFQHEHQSNQLQDIWTIFH